MEPTVIARFFEWADAQGLTMKDIAERTGYYFRHVYKVRAGQIKDTRSFAARAVLAFGAPARDIFFADVPVGNDINLSQDTPESAR